MTKTRAERNARDDDQEGGRGLEHVGTPTGSNHNDREIHVPSSNTNEATENANGSEDPPLLDGSSKKSRMIKQATKSTNPGNYNNTEIVVPPSETMINNALFESSMMTGKDKAPTATANDAPSASNNSPRKVNKPAIDEEGHLVVGGPDEEENDAPVPTMQGSLPMEGYLGLTMPEFTAGIPHRPIAEAGAFAAAPDAPLERMEMLRLTTDHPEEPEASGSDLAQAFAVEQEPIHGEATPYDMEAARRGEGEKEQREKCAIVTAVFLVVVAVVTVVLVFATKGNPREPEDENASKPLPSLPEKENAPTPLPSMTYYPIPVENLEQLYIQLPEGTKASLLDPTTPQSMAWEWLLTHQNVTQLPEWRKKQIFALSTFFFAFGGPEWPKASHMNWLNDTIDECSWITTDIDFISDQAEVYLGIPNLDSRQCNDGGQITTIFLQHLQGLSDAKPFIPPELALLSSLKHFMVLSGRLSVTLSSLIPADLLQLSNLEIFVAANIKLLGSIPTVLASLTSLQYLLLNVNELTGPIPSELGLMTSLKRLESVPFSESQLSGSIPTQLGLCTALSHLDLSGNSLTGSLPSELGHLTSVTVLDLYANILSGSIPSELGMMTALVHFELGKSALTGSIPSELGFLGGMTSLGLGDNIFSGAIPSELGSLTKMIDLKLHTNALIGGSIPTELGLLTSTAKLDLQDNRLTGPIPTQLGLSTSIFRLDLNHNSLTGPIPSELGLMTTLVRFYLGGNACTGFIPTELGLMVKTSILFLSDNTLMGQIPSELGMMTSLTEFGLGGNNLSGAIPSELGLFTSLTRLELLENSLSGAIPSELGSMTSMIVLYLSGNAFTGFIPTELGLLTSMTLLYMHQNSLAGSFPSELGIMTNLQQLRIESNAFTGFIPTELGLLTTMTILYMHQNSLSGSFPNELGFMANLWQLRIESNAFTGTIPMAFDALTDSLETLTLASNSLLSGTISESLCSLGLFESDLVLGLSFDCDDPRLCGCLWCPCSAGSSNITQDNQFSSMWASMFQPSP